MLTVIWSPVYGQTGTTTITCALAAASAKYGTESVLLMRTKFKQTGLCQIMDRTISHSHFGMNAAGIDKVLMAEASGLVLKSSFENALINLEDGFFIMEGSRSIHREVFEKELNKGILSILKTAKENYGCIYVEAENGESDENTVLFQKADRILVCLPQNLYVINSYLEQDIAKEKKRINIIGRYMEDSTLNITNLNRRFHKQLYYSFLPFYYSEELMDAYSAGRLNECFEETYFNMPVKKENTKVFHARDAIIKINTALKERNLS